MSFPKPDSVTPSTQKRYVIVARRLLAKIKLRYPNPSADQIVEDLISRKPTITKATFRQYKAALCFFFTYMIETSQSTTSQNRVLLTMALDRLKSTTSDGCLRRSARTSAKKSRTISVPDFGLICSYLANRQNQATATHLLSAVTVLWLSGIRPCELLDLKPESLSRGTVRLTILSAKTTNGRGLGSVRTLDLSGLDDGEVERVLAWPAFAKQLSATAKDPIGHISQYFGRVVRRILSPRKKYPSFYSFRHQVTGNLKAGGQSLSQIAAILGHASDATSGRHYLRKQGGRTDTKITADPALVKGVRARAKSFATSTTPQHSEPLSP